MKKNLLSYFLIALFSLFIFSCNDDVEPGNVQQGEVEFGFSPKDISQTKTKSLKADVEPSAIVVSIKDATGTLVYDMEEIELFNMSGYFISKPLSLLVGAYSVEKFFVIDAEGNVIYASPLEDSDLAYLVSEPLPIEFNVSKDETLKLVPEVLSTEVLTPEDFGYTTFSFDIVETFDFLLSVFTYNETNENFELTDAILSILANETTIYTDSLQAITNQIKINDGFDSYILTIEKEGYTTYVDTFTNAELKLYFNSEDNGSLVVILENGEPVAGMACPGAPTVTDADGNVYPTVQIGDQCCMAENLRVGYMIDSVSNPFDNGIIEKWCYNDNPENCETYGGLYNWDEMMAYNLPDTIYTTQLTEYTTTFIKKTQGICPNGWHLPTFDEWNILHEKNKDGFNFQQTGIKYVSDYRTDFIGYSTVYWTTTQATESRMFGRAFLEAPEVMFCVFDNTDFNNFDFSVRCIKN